VDGPVPDVIKCRHGNGVCVAGSGVAHPFGADPLCRPSELERYRVIPQPKPGRRVPLPGHRLSDAHPVPVAGGPADLRAAVYRVPVGPGCNLRHTAVDGAGQEDVVQTIGSYRPPLCRYRDWGVIIQPARLPDFNPGQFRRGGAHRQRGGSGPDGGSAYTVRPTARRCRSPRITQCTASDGGRKWDFGGDGLVGDNRVGVMAERGCKTAGPPG
jgi:hypothetical protein